MNATDHYMCFFFPAKVPTHTLSSAAVFDPFLKELSLQPEACRYLESLAVQYISSLV